jgi:hypothetical protein
MATLKFRSKPDHIMLKLNPSNKIQRVMSASTGQSWFESYLLTLVEAWLRDLAYHWKSEDPPGSEELGRAGLLEKLEGGTTQRLGA